MAKIDLIMLNMGNFYDWDHGVVNRNRFILQNFEKDERINKILTVDFLPIKLKQTLRSYWQNIFVESKNFEMLYGDLFSACYQRNPKLFTYSTVKSFFSLRQTAKEIERLSKLLKLENPVIWSCNPMFVELLDVMKESKFIFDAVDNWLEHPIYPKIMPKARLNENYAKIAHKADLLFTVSESMVKFFNKKNRYDKLSCLANGVDYEHFNNPKNLQNNNLLSDEKRLIIGYLGTIENRVDFDLLKFIAEKNPDKLLVLGGPIWQSAQRDFTKKLAKLPNVKTFGRISFSLAPAFINRFDVALIPHKTSSFSKSMNPMKLYDYLACGRPVVSTFGSDIGNLGEYVYQAADYAQFNEKINQAIKENSPIKENLRRQEAQKRSWTIIVGEMMNKIENIL